MGRLRFLEVMLMSMKSLEEARAVLAMPEYRSAKAKIGKWNALLAKCTKPKAKAMEKEASAFFSSLQAESPLAYSYLASDRSELLEKIHFKLTGLKVIIN